MHRSWVVNASPLILLGKTDYLGLLGALANQVVVPRAVAGEVGAKSVVTQYSRRSTPSLAFTIADNETVTEILSRIWALARLR